MKHKKASKFEYFVFPINRLYTSYEIIDVVTSYITARLEIKKEKKTKKNKIWLIYFNSLPQTRVVSSNSSLLTREEKGPACKDLVNISVVWFVESMSIKWIVWSWILSRTTWNQSRCVWCFREKLVAICIALMLLQ